MKTLTINDFSTADIIKTRNVYAENCDECVSDAKRGLVKVDDIDEYVNWKLKEKQLYISGKKDNDSSFLQMARFLQRGVMLPFPSDHYHED